MKKNRGSAARRWAILDGDDGDDGVDSQDSHGAEYRGTQDATTLRLLLTSCSIFTILEDDALRPCVERRVSKPFRLYDVRKKSEEPRRCGVRVHVRYTRRGRGSMRMALLSFLVLGSIEAPTRLAPPSPSRSSGAGTSIFDWRPGRGVKTGSFHYVARKATSASCVVQESLQVARGNRCSCVGSSSCRFKPQPRIFPNVR
jgi:hypothetical protein